MHERRERDAGLLAAGRQVRLRQVVGHGQQGGRAKEWRGNALLQTLKYLDKASKSTSVYIYLNQELCDLGLAGEKPYISSPATLTEGSSLRGFSCNPRALSPMQMTGKFAREEGRKAAIFSSSVLVVDSSLSSRVKFCRFSYLPPIIV